MADDPTQKEIRPDLIRRTTGGWLAVSPTKCSICIGVTAPTEEEAIARFRFEFGRWLEILALK
jgi:hypothetical protein